MFRQLTPPSACCTPQSCHDLFLIYFLLSLHFLSISHLVTDLWCLVNECVCPHEFIYLFRWTARRQSWGETVLLRKQSWNPLQKIKIKNWGVKTKTERRQHEEVGAKQKKSIFSLGKMVTLLQELGAGTFPSLLFVDKNLMLFFFFLSFLFLQLFMPNTRRYVVVCCCHLRGTSTTSLVPLCSLKVNNHTCREKNLQKYKQNKLSDNSRCGLDPGLQDQVSPRIEAFGPAPSLSSHRLP